MKKNFFLTAIIAGSLSFNSAEAQGVRVNINLGTRPVYVAPAPVVDDYYYLPDAEAYYSVPEHVYYYQNQGCWISSPRLAGRYRDYDYSRMRHYVVNEPRPYLRNDYYRSRYYNNPQMIVRNNRNYGNQNDGRFDGGGNNNRGYNNQNYSRDNRDNGGQGNPHNNDNYRGGRNDRHDNGNHNGWNRY